MEAVQKALKSAGAAFDVVGPYFGGVKAKDGSSVNANKTYGNSDCVPYDAVFVASAPLQNNVDARALVAKAYKRAKAIGVAGESDALLKAALPEGASMGELGVDVPLNTFVAFVAKRHWGRKVLDRVAA